MPSFFTYSSLLSLLVLILGVTLGLYLWQFRGKWKPQYLVLGVLSELALVIIGIFILNVEVGELPFVFLQTLTLGLVVFSVVLFIFYICEVEKQRAQTLLERQRLEAAERDARQLAEALYRAGTAMAATLNFEQVFKVMLEQLAQIIPYDGANVMWVEGAYAYMKGRQGYTWLTAEAAAIFADFKFEIKHTANLQHMMETCQPFLISNIHEYAGWMFREPLENTRSWLGAPLIVDDEVVAFLSVDSLVVDFYNSVHADRLTAFASQAALALGNSQLYAQVQQYVGRLQESNREVQLAWLEAEARAVEAETLRQAGAAVAATLNHAEALDQILEQLARVVPCDGASVQLLRRDHFEIIGARGFERDLIGVQFSIHDEVPQTIILRDAQPFIAPDIEMVYPAFTHPKQFKVRGWLGVPLMVRDQLIGLLSVDSKEPNHFTSAHVRLAAAFADQAALALENTQLYQRAKRNAERLALLYQASQKFSRHLEYEQLYLAIHQAASALVPCEAFFLTLVDHAGQEFENVYMFDHGQRWPARRFPITTGIAGYAITHNESLKIDQLSQTDLSRYQNVEHFGHTQERTESVLLALMRVGGNVIGALSVQSYTPYIYSDDDVELLELLAASAAVAIENARYYHAALKEAERRAQLYEASQQISDKLEIEQLYAAIHQAAARLLPCQVFVISLLDETRREVENVYLFDRGSRWPPIRAQLGQGLIGYALSKKESMRLDDTLKIDPALFTPIRFGDPGQITRSAVVALMRRGGKIIGALSAQVYPQSAYTDLDLKTLELLAAQAAIAIDNARYYHEALYDIDRHTALYDASQHMSDKLDLEQLYTAIHESVTRLMPCEAFVISLLVNEVDIDNVYLFDQGQRFPTTHNQLSEGLIGYTIASSSSLRVDDLTQVDPAQFKSVRFGSIVESTRSALVALMRRGGKIIGAISTQSYAKNVYPEADLKMLELLAAQAAILIDNARLFAKIQLYATVDELTSIYNRRYLMEHAQLEFERAKRETAVLSLVMLDVDFFKRINDGYGHLVGDQILRGICQACRQYLRSTDTFGRFGGEEFVVVLPDTTLAGAQRIAERLRAECEKVRAQSKKGEVSVTVSFGVAEFFTSYNLLSEDERTLFTVDNLIDQADQALYVAKRQGKNCVRLFPIDVQAELSQQAE